MIKIKKKVFIDWKYERQNVSMYYEPNSLNYSDDINSDKLFNCWGHNVFNGKREKQSFHPKTT